jgi:prepilin-type N-terminal cleavage/methylation domain-containing protein
MQKGLTLVELLAVLSILALIATFALTRFGRQLDRLAVQSAAADVAGAFALARNGAIARTTFATVYTDSSRHSVTVVIGGDTVLSRSFGAVYGVALRSNRDSLTYDQIGHGYGASNQTIVLARGQAVDSVVLSRLGRVRYRP